MKINDLNQTSEIGSPIVRAQLWNLSEDVSLSRTVFMAEGLCQETSTDI